MKQIILYVREGKCIVARHATKIDGETWLCDNGMDYKIFELGKMCWLNIMMAKLDMKAITGATRYYKHINPDGRPMWLLKRDKLAREGTESDERAWKRVS